MNKYEELIAVENFISKKYTDVKTKDLRILKKSFEEERLENKKSLGDLGETFLILSLAYQKELELRELANLLIKNYQQELLFIINHGL